MARRRMIDPNIWQSEDVSKLTVRQRLLLIGLFSNADDEGKGRGNLSYIRSMVFPYDDIPIKEIEKDINNIAEFISVVFYEVDGNTYYKFTKWEKWQRVDKPQKSVLPDPPELLQNDSRITPERFQSDSCLKEEKRKERKGKERNICADYTPDFETFWENYPRHIEKKRAFAAWNARIKNKADPQNMISAAINYCNYCRSQKTEERYIKHAGSFLSDKEAYKDWIKGEEETSYGPYTGEPDRGYGRPYTG